MSPLIIFEDGLPLEKWKIAEAPAVAPDMYRIRQQIVSGHAGTVPDRSIVDAHAEGPTSTQGHRLALEPLGLAAAEAAALLGISESHFYCMHKTGKLGPLPVRLGRAVRWSRQELVDWFGAGSPPRNRWLAIRNRISNN